MIAGANLLPVLRTATPASTNPANEVAKKLTGRDYVSWSALSTFRQCPLRYRFKYIDGLPEETVSSALVFGTGIHTALEQHYQAQLAGDPDPFPVSVPVLMREFGNRPRGVSEGGA